MTLRELVATEVMGWHSIEGGWGKWYDSQEHHVVLPCDWQPDTNIADAWRVVEKMQTFATGSVERERFEYAFAGLRLDTASSQQAASAICIIALRACGVSEDRIEQARRKA